jgi:hypothetical protein
MIEKMQYIHLDTERGDLVVQLDGGGAMQAFRPGMPVEQVVDHLRMLALLLERGAEERDMARNHSRRAADGATVEKS